MRIRSLLLCSFLLAPALFAQLRDQAAERALFAAANRERAALHLSDFRWDNALARAAQEHTEQMAAAQNITHDLPGEAPLGPRLLAAGARLSAFAENVGLAGSADAIHQAWMHSEGHRRNLLNPAYDIIGIAVYRAGDSLYATEDFGTAVTAVSADDADLQVRDALAKERQTRSLPQLRVVPPAGKAPNGCSAPPLDHSAPLAPGASRSMINYTTPTPSTLPPVTRTRVDDPRFSSYAISVCQVNDPAGFVTMRVSLAFTQ